MKNREDARGGHVLRGAEAGRDVGGEAAAGGPARRGLLVGRGGAAAGGLGRTEQQLWQVRRFLALAGSTGALLMSCAREEGRGGPGG